MVSVITVSLLSHTTQDQANLKLGNTYDQLFPNLASAGIEIRSFDQRYVPRQPIAPNPFVVDLITNSEQRLGQKCQATTRPRQHRPNRPGPLGYACFLAESAHVQRPALPHGPQHGRRTGFELYLPPRFTLQVQSSQVGRGAFVLPSHRHPSIFASLKVDRRSGKNCRQDHPAYAAI